MSANEQPIAVPLTGTQLDVLAEALNLVVPALSDEECYDLAVQLRDHIKWYASHAPRGPRSTKMPRWMVTRTLLGGEPDRNRRSLYDRMTPVCNLNQRMAPWHPDDDKALTQLVEYLNSIEPPDAV